MVAFWKDWNLIGPAFLVAGKAGSLGAMAGFVFGIPKLAENAQGAAGIASLPRPIGSGSSLSVFCLLPISARSPIG